MDTLYQVSTLDALLAGDYDGRIDFRRLKRHGNFGLGTFDALDGEMVAVDGVFYQVRVDGIATRVSLDQLTPFSAVTYFRANDSFRVRGATSCSELHELLLRRFPSDELLYAIKVTGRFTALKTRSVPAQEKPYPPLAEVIPQQQVVFDFAEVDATLAGFWLPSVLSEVNVAGFHFHAIMTDTMTGGHVLDCEIRDVEIELDYTNELQLQFADGERRSHSRPKKSGQGKRSQQKRPPVSHW